MVNDFSGEARIVFYNLLKLFIFLRFNLSSQVTQMLRLKSSSLLSLTNQVVVSNVDAGILKFKLLH